MHTTASRAIELFGRDVPARLAIEPPSWPLGQRHRTRRVTAERRALFTIYGSVNCPSLPPLRLREPRRPPAPRPRYSSRTQATCDSPDRLPLHNRSSQHRRGFGPGSACLSSESGAPRRIRTGNLRIKGRSPPNQRTCAFRPSFLVWNRLSPTRSSLVRIRRLV